MLRGWTQEHAIAMNWILEAQKLVQAKQSKINGETNIDTEIGDIETLIYFVHGNLQKYIWKDGNFILGECFMDEDVSPRAATVIQSMVPMRSQGIDLNQEAEKL
jgi:hypothetical protein